MKKIIAFTLAEIVICLTIIGVLAAITITTIDTQNFYQKSYLTGARKILNEFNQASIRIREEQKTICPDGSFLSDVSNNQAIFSCNLSKSDIVSVYEQYIKFKTKYTGTVCTSNATGNTSMCGSDLAAGDRPGFKLQNGAFVAFEIFDSLEICKHYDFEEIVQLQKEGKGAEISSNNAISSTSGSNVAMLSVTESGANGAKLKTQTQCWGRLWVDMNGKSAPNIEGQDVFGFYIGSQGLVN